jgi:iron-sulfur cluster repair protein YtfE (RIC family)
MAFSPYTAGELASRFYRMLLVVQRFRIHRSSGGRRPARACRPAAPCRGLEELEALTHMHLHMENGMLFPRAATRVGAAGFERL